MADEPKLTDADLRQFTGADELFKHWSGLVHYTPGCKFVADRGEAHWLLDAIASHQLNPLAKLEPFQHWVLTRTVGTAAVLEMNDGNSTKAIIRQTLEYYDFPLPQIAMYCVQDGEIGRVVMLVSEY